MALTLTSMFNAQCSMFKGIRVCALVLLWTVSIGPLTLTAGASADENPPLLTAPVNDFAHVIDAESARELDRRIRALQSATGDVVVIATVQTFKPYGDIREYATKMFENGGRGIGAKGKDNGLLIVLAVEDRQIKIEPGYALEEFITDGFAGETRNVIAPEFRQGRYGSGLLAGTTRIINRIAERRGVTLTDVPQQPVSSSPERPRIPISLIILFILIVIMLSRSGSGPRRRRRYWGGGPWSGWSSGVGPFGGGGFGGGFGGFGGGFGGGGGGGGGFGGFGGGRSGGGGASGRW
jgi:uncharacterized protein